MRVGFIGLGNIGRPLASRIAAAGHSLVVHDICREHGEALIDKGAAWADSPQQVAKQSEIVCFSLPGPDEFERTVYGVDGVISGIDAGKICVDFTTNSASLVQRVGDELAKQESGLLDAPVSGGVEGARKGSLTVLVGGDLIHFAAASPLFDIVAGKVIHLGPLGTASICKVLHNSAVFCTNLAMMECLTVGVKLGVAAEKLIDVFQSSGLGRNLDLQVALPATLFRGEFQPRFAMRTAQKDMKLAVELAEDADVPVQLMNACAADMTEAVERGWGDRDNTIFLTLQEQRADAKVRLPDDANGQMSPPNDTTD